MAKYHSQQTKASKYGLMVTTCDWNNNIDCIFHDHCDKCGWHPLVEEKRKERIREKLKERCP